MLYRDLHHAADDMDQIGAPLHRAILATSTGEMFQRAEQARAAASHMLHRLDQALHDCADSVEVETSDGRVEVVFARKAVDALQQAVAQASGALDDTDALSVRARLLSCKTQADFADAYLRASIGEEQT